MGSTEDPMYLALTDYPYPQRFDINTLDTLELLRPANGFGMTGCTHWQREPDTDNSINFACKVRNLSEAQRAFCLKICQQSTNCILNMSFLIKTDPHL